MGTREISKVASKQANVPHGFTVANIITLVVLILILWGVHYGSVVAPQIRSTADKVVKLNDLSNVDMKVGWGGCSIPIKGNL